MGVSAGGIAGTSLLPFLEWDGLSHESLVSDGTFGRTGSRRRWLLGLASVTSGLFLALQYATGSWVRRRWWSLVPATGAVVATGLAVWYVVQDFYGVRAGYAGPAFVMCGLALTAGWLVYAVWPPQAGHDVMEDAGAYPWLAAVLTVVLVAAPAADWAFSGRDHTTATATPASSPATGTGSDGERWRTDAERLEWAATAGRYLVVRNQQGVQVRDTANGEHLRHYYRHDDTDPVASAIAPDGRTVVVIFAVPTGAYLATALDVATGVIRWEWERPRQLPLSIVSYSGGFAVEPSGGTVTSAYDGVLRAQWLAAAGGTMVIGNAACVWARFRAEPDVP